MNKTYLAALVAYSFVVLGGCSSADPMMSSGRPEAQRGCAADTSSEQHCNTMNMISPAAPESLPPQQVSGTADASLFRTQLHFLSLNDYVEQMALDLSHDILTLKLAYPIAVASFVQLDASLTHTDTLGNQLAELFIAEMRKNGLAVNDHKVTGNIQVTATGDFAFSRDVKQLKRSQSIGYVLSGTMIKTDKGVMVNARVVGLSSNVVVAATSKLIPNLLLD